MSDLITAAAQGGGVATRYLNWGVVHVSLGNVAVILAMVLVFVLALVLPFPGAHDERPDGDDDRG